MLLAVFSYFLSPLRISQELANIVRHPIDVAFSDQKTGFPVDYGIVNTRVTRAYNGERARTRF